MSTIFNKTEINSTNLVYCYFGRFFIHWTVYSLTMKLKFNAPKPRAMFAIYANKLSSYKKEWNIAVRANSFFSIRRNESRFQRVWTYHTHLHDSLCVRTHRLYCIEYLSVCLCVFWSLCLLSAMCKNYPKLNFICILCMWMWMYIGVIFFLNVRISCVNWV